MNTQREDFKELTVSAFYYETEAYRQHQRDLAQGITCQCWTYAPQPDCTDHNSTRHYWAW